MSRPDNWEKYENTTLNQDPLQNRMKICNTIVYLLAAAFAMPAIFKKMNFGAVGRRRFGMTSNSIRTYFKEQQRRAAKQSRIDNILARYFQFLDSKQ